MTQTALTESPPVPPPPLLEARALTKTFRSRAGRALAVDGVSLSVPPHTTVGVVGESGCGKSTLGRLLVGLLAPDDGAVAYEGQVVGPSRSAPVARNVQMVFQDPYSALNPKASIGESIALPLRAHGEGRRAARERAKQLLVDVGLHANHVSYYPHQLSGGQRQRVNIARALALQPRLVICDEPVSALDKSIQAQILRLLRELQERQGFGYLFISHDLNVVEYMSEQLAVMYLGQVVETGRSEQLYRDPLHPYTQALLASIPRLDGPVSDSSLVDGELPSPIDPPSGCRFRTRCPFASEACAAVPPPLVEVEPGHQVACHLHAAPGATPLVMSPSPARPDPNQEDNP